MNMGPSSGLPLHKGTPRKTLARRQQREEQQVKKAVRAACVERDGDCRLGNWEQNPDDWHSDFVNGEWRWSACDGPSEWAHKHSHRRSQTVNQAPEKRHVSAASLILCRRHHAAYDRHELLMTALTRRGCNGPLKFRRSK